MFHIFKSPEKGKMPSSGGGTSPLMKPLSAIAGPGMYLFYKYNEFKRQQQESHRRKVTEKELDHLNHKIDKLLAKLDEQKSETVPTYTEEDEEECVICMSAKATMQTYPCAHKVICRKCFIKTIQIAVTQRCLPLRCVICRQRILKLRQSSIVKINAKSVNKEHSSMRPKVPSGVTRSPRPSKVYAK